MSDIFIINSGCGYKIITKTIAFTYIYDLPPTS